MLPETSQNNEMEDIELSELLNTTQQRFFTFLAKLEERMQELTDAALPELETMRTEDERGYGTMLNGVLGQLGSIRDKAWKTQEEKVGDMYQQLDGQIDVFSPYRQLLQDFRMACFERFNNGFEEKYNACRDRIEDTQSTDYEVIYQQILDEHERIKNQFRCHQCGAGIPLTKLYFTTVHLACPSCATKNTFTPSTLAQGLEHIGRSLAEQRTQHLLDRYYAAQQAERDLYHAAHDLKLKSYAIDNQTEKQKIQQEIEHLKARRTETEKNLPGLYEHYQRAMFDEWKRLVPDLAEETEKFYQSLRGRNY